MTTAYVLMTAMPPTLGHKALIEYAAIIADSVQVIICTQPKEPYAFERMEALRRAVQGQNVTVNHKHRELPQEPSNFPGFWEMWGGFLLEYGFKSGDFIVASEDYGVRLAQQVNGIFMPFDLDRVIVKAKATWVRENPYLWFHSILPEFRPYLKRSVTIFGAESTGKTTLAKSLAKEFVRGQFYPEWARPYLETVGPEVTNEKMENIWDGQRALQMYARQNTEEMISFQDTDLLSTYGYWKMWDSRAPQLDVLLEEAYELRSDLYIVTSSNIPFEQDQLRYGGDKRESTDQYWIDMLESMNLDYIYLESSAHVDRVNEAFAEVFKITVNPINNPLEFIRPGN